MVYGGEALSGCYTGGYLYSGGQRKKREIQKGKEKSQDCRMPWKQGKQGFKKKGESAAKE